MDSDSNGIAEASIVDLQGDTLDIRIVEAITDVNGNAGVPMELTEGRGTSRSGASISPASVEEAIAEDQVYLIVRRKGYAPAPIRAEVGHLDEDTPHIVALSSGCQIRAVVTGLDARRGATVVQLHWDADSILPDIRRHERQHSYELNSQTGRHERVDRRLAGVDRAMELHSDGEAVFVDQPVSHFFRIDVVQQGLVVGSSGPNVSKAPDTEIDIDLQSCALIGVLVDEAGAPLAGRTVLAFQAEASAGLMFSRLRRSPIREAVTDSMGAFEIDGLTPGAYELCGTGLDERPQRYGEASILGMSVLIPEHCNEAQRIVLRDNSRSIMGKVMTENGAAVPGASVYLVLEGIRGGLSTRAGPDGVYRINRVPNGIGRISAGIPGTMQRTAPALVESELQNIVFPAMKVGTIIITPDTTSSRGACLASVSLTSVDGTMGQNKTALKGGLRCEFKGVPQGSYIVVATGTNNTIGCASVVLGHLEARVSLKLMGGRRVGIANAAGWESVRVCWTAGPEGLRIPLGTASPHQTLWAWIPQDAVRLIWDTGSDDRESYMDLQASDESALIRIPSQQ